MQIELALKALTLKLSEHYSNAEDTEKIVIKCALTATAADAIGGAIPGLAVPATIIGCFGAVWVMYGKLCSTLGISLKKNVLKLLARADRACWQDQTRAMPLRAGRTASRRSLGKKRMSDSALKAEVKNTKVSKQDLDAAKKAYEENKDSEKDE